MALKLSISRLSRREKVIVGFMIALLCIYVLAQFVVADALANKRDLAQKIKKGEALLMDMRLEKAEYEEVTRQIAATRARFENRETGFRLFSFLDRLAGENGVKQYIEYMNPSTSPIPDSPYKVSMVELKLSGVTTEMLMDFLYGIESSRNQVQVRRLAVSETGKDRRLVNAVILAVTLET